MSNLIAAMQSMQAANNENLRFVCANFSSGPKLYTYKTLDTTIEEGDKVIVHTPSDKFEVVTVRGVVEADEVDLAAFRYAWVVQKIDTTQYDKLIEQEDTLLKMLRSKQRNAAAKHAADALLDGSSAEEREGITKLVRL
jgi:hypothetical protein